MERRPFLSSGKSAFGPMVDGKEGLRSEMDSLGIRGQKKTGRGQVGGRGRYHSFIHVEKRDISRKRKDYSQL